MKDKYLYYLLGVIFWIVGAYIILRYIPSVFIKTVALILITFTLIRGINNKRKEES